jgi:hypothetical protein
MLLGLATWLDMQKTQAEVRKKNAEATTQENANEMTKDYYEKSKNK